MEHLRIILVALKAKLSYPIWFFLLLPQLLSPPGNNLGRFNSVFIQGICEVCQSFQESLENIDGTYVCNRCREELPFYQ